MHFVFSEIPPERGLTLHSGFVSVVLYVFRRSHMCVFVKYCFMTLIVS